jgi:non-heme chloroperoxidase
MRLRLGPLLLGAALAAAARAPAAPPPGTERFVEVEKGVKLQVIDFGGAGRPLLLLAGLGGRAGDFAPFASQLAARCHVYALTRRGFEPSSIPAAGYDADRLGDDVVAVVDALKLDRPILAGHSLAGEELTSVGTRHPEKVSGLIYLDAAYPYAFYNPERGELMIDANALRAELDRLDAVTDPAQLRDLLGELAADSARLSRDVAARQAQDAKLPPPPAARGPAPAVLPPVRAIFQGEKRYGPVTAVPVLAIFAYPHDLGNAPVPPAVRSVIAANDRDATGAQIEAFARANPRAKIVRLPGASHLVYRSNEADVLREVDAFIAALP